MSTNIKIAINKDPCLSGDNGMISAQGMLPFLLRKEIANVIFAYNSLESTNRTAKEMAMSGAEHGATILADSQTAGKGRYNRTFYSPPGHGIYMSVILRLQQLLFDTPTVATPFAAVSVCEAIEAVTGKVIRIKWANDIFLDGKKICGILTETGADGKNGIDAQWIVVGIGINFSTPLMDFPENLRQTAGSVFMDDSTPITRSHLAAEIINRIVTPVNPYNEKKILEKYKQRLFILGKKILVTQRNETYRAVAIDIDDIGRLLVKKDSGEILSLSAGEITMLKMD